MSISTLGRFAFNSAVTLAVFSFVFISAPNAALAATSGPNFPDVGSEVNGPGSVGWSNEGNISSDNTSYATVVLPNNGSVSEYLQATDFDFNIPANAIINGIQVSINRQSSSNSGNNSVNDVDVRLVKGGVITGDDKATTSDWPTSFATANYGGTSDLWGTSWTPEDINGSNFGVVLSVVNQSTFSDRTASVDYISITVTYTVPVVTTGTLIVTKVVTNDDGGAGEAADFSFSATGPSAIATTAFEADGSNSFTVNAGTYTVTEVSAPGYNTTYNNCTNVSIAAGETKTCTITNNDIAAPTNPISATPFTEGKVSITFDDGWESQYTNALPLLTAKGLKATFYIYTNAILGNFDDYMSSVQIGDLATKGHELGAHTRSHSDLMLGSTTVSYADFLAYEIQGSKDDLVAMGANSVTTFAYPYGSYGASGDVNFQIHQALQNAGMTGGARSADTGATEDDAAFNSASSNKWALGIGHVTNNTSLSTIQGWITDAKENNVWLVLMFHEIADPFPGSCAGGEGDTTECASKQMLSDILNYLVNNHVCVQTVADVLAGVECSSANQAPVLDAIGNKSVNVGAELTFTAHATDGNNDTLEYSLAGTVPAGATINSSTGAFAWTPGAAGTFTFTVNVADGHTGTDSEEITVTVTDGAPIITLNGEEVVTVAPGATYTDAGATATDVVDDALNIPLVITTTGLPVNTAVLGDHVITYSVTDSSSNTTTATRTVKVVDADAPTISEHADVTAQIDTTVATEVVVNYDLPTATDSFDGALVVTCSPVSGSLFVLGTTEVTCSATDSSLNTVSTTFNVIVADVNAPVAQNGSVSVNHPDAVEITLVATDNTVPAQTLSYSIVDQPTKGTLGSVSGDKVTYTPNEAPFSGTDTFTFKANDGSGDSNTATVTITINLPAVCPSGYTQNGDTCVSDTPTPACGAGYTLNEAKTECVPQTQAPSCPEGSTQSGGECEYPATEVGDPICTDGGTYTGAGKCLIVSGDLNNPADIYDATCTTEGATINIETNKCEVPTPPTSACPANFTYNDGSCTPDGGNVAPACAVENIDENGNCPPATTSLTCPVEGYGKLEGGFCLADEPVVTPPPSGGSSSGSGGGGGGSSATYRVRINDGDAETSSTNVTIKLNRGSSNATQVWISNDSDFSTGAWAPWSSIKNWTLASGEGQKTVYVRFGRSNDTVLSTEDDSITLVAGEVLGAETTNGMTAEEIAALTTLLRSLGMSETTINEVIAALGGPAVLGASTGSDFVFTQTLQLGSTGNEVVELQKVLIAEGFLKIAAPTGYFGPLTEAAVKAYQTAHGIEAVGIVGPKTRAELNK